MIVIIWFGAAALGLKLVVFVYKFFTGRKKYNENVAKISSVQQRRKELMLNWRHQVLSQISADDSERITNLSFTQLKNKLQSGDLTAVKVLHAYQYKVAKTDEKLNYVCGVVDEAEEMAAALDQLSADEKKSLPLFGIPISVKESLAMKGYSSTFGCAYRIDTVEEDTAVVVMALVQKGAVPFIRTNVPQTCMSIDSHNPIYGQTLNPHDTTRVSGGSSGGEGAAIGSGGSILGIGTDLGGSIRIPGAWSGCAAFKPTAGILSEYGQPSVDLNERIIQITAGPLAKDVDGLVEAMRCFTSDEAHTLDCSVPPVPFNDKELSSSKPLKIGFFYTAEPMEISQSCRRAIDLAIQHLESKGHQLVKWTPPDFVFAVGGLFCADLFADKSQSLIKALENDVLSPVIADSVYLNYIPKWLRAIMADYLLRPFFPEYFRNYLKYTAGFDHVKQFWEHENKVKDYRRMVVKSLQNQGIDAILCPALPVPAMLVGNSKDAIGVMLFMGYFNLLNFPAGVLPVTKVTAEDVKTDKENFPPKDMWHKVMKKNLEGSEGLPMAAQLASFPHQDERCLRLMKELESCIKQ